MWVTALALLPDGTLLAMFFQRLLKYAEGKWQRVYNFEQRLTSSDWVERMLWWRDGLWLGSAGLWFYQDENLQWISALPCDRVTALLLHDERTLVVGFHKAGVWRSSDGQHWEQLAYPVDPGSLYALTTDAQGNIWTVVQGDEPYPDAKRPVRPFTTSWNDSGWTTAMMEVWKYDQARAVWERYALLPKAIRATAITVDAENRVWIGAEGDGVWCYQNQLLIHKSRRVDVESLYADQHGRVWLVGLDDLEPHIWEHGTWKHILPSPGTDTQGNPLLWDFSIPSASCFDRRQERIWLGTRHGEIGWISTSPADELVVPRHAPWSEFYAPEVDYE